MTSKQFVGSEFEEAYVKVFGGQRNGGFHDGGKDVITGNPEIPFVQVKAGPKGAQEFLKESLCRRRFIPLCVGEPGSRDEVFQALKQFGAWVGREIPERERIMRGVQSIRTMLM